MTSTEAKPNPNPNPSALRPDITIVPAHDGLFFVRDGAYRVWDGDEWRGFGEAEKYSNYGAAMKARRAAIAKAPAQ